MKRYHVLLATSTSWLSFSRMPRLLDMADCSIDVISSSKALVAQRKFIENRYFVDRGVEAIANKLLSHLEENPLRYDWVIIGDDDLFGIVAGRANESVNYWFPSPRDEESIKFFMSKLTFMQRCRENGFYIAPYHICDSLEQALLASVEFGFPVIVKIAHSVGASGVTRINSIDELAKYVATINESFAVQKFVGGKVIEAEILFDHGRPRCWMVSELLNCWPKVFGASTARKLIDVPNMHQMLEKIGKLTGYHGFASIDSILPNDGGPLMLSEINPRTTTGYHFDPRIRREFAHAITEMLEAKSFQDYTPLSVTGHNEALFPESFYYLSSHLKELNSWKLALNSLQRVPIDDPMYLFQMAKDFRHFIIGEIKNHTLKPRK